MDPFKDWKLLSQICSKARTQFTTPKLSPTTTQELETLVEIANRTTASIPRVEAIPLVTT